MDIFISWSGPRSKHIAEALRWWLPNVLQAVMPFLSSQDIRKGARGNVVISEHLEKCGVGILCLTPENLKEPWILFEAGALSKLSSAYVCTYLFELKPSDIEPPLGQFQHTQANKLETKSLVNTINAELAPERRLDVKRLDDAFDVWWPKLEEALSKVPPAPASDGQPEKRSDESKLDEILALLRNRHTTRLQSGTFEASSIEEMALLRQFEGITQDLAQRVLLTFAGYTVIPGLPPTVPPEIFDGLVKLNFLIARGDGVYEVTARGHRMARTLHNSM